MAYNKQSSEQTMQPESQNPSPTLPSLPCLDHPSTLVQFICISHSNCPKSNLLCIDCIDEMSGEAQHQIISVRKFCRYVKLYEEQAGACLKGVRDRVGGLVREINRGLDSLEYLLVGEEEEGEQERKFGVEAFREKTKIIAKRKLWTRLQKKKNDMNELEKEIKIEVKHNEKNTLEVLEKLLDYSRACFDKLRNEPKIQSQNAEGSMRAKLRKRDREKDKERERREREKEKEKEKEKRREKEKEKGKNKKVEKKKPLPQMEESSSEESEDSSVVSVSEQAFTNPRKRRPCYKRYSVDEKLNILLQGKSGTDKKALARKYKVSTSTVLRWQKAFESQLKQMMKGTKVSKKGEEASVDEVKEQSLM